MPNLKEIKQTILQEMSPEEVARLDFPKIKGNPPEAVVAFINQMEQLLTKEQCLLIMAEQGCGRSGVTDKEHREFGHIHKGKSVAEKLDLMKENGPHKGLLKRLNKMAHSRLPGVMEKRAITDVFAGKLAGCKKKSSR